MGIVGTCHFLYPYFQAQNMAIKICGIDSAHDHKATGRAKQVFHNGLFYSALKMRLCIENQGSVQECILCRAGLQTQALNIDGSSMRQNYAAAADAVAVAPAVMPSPVPVPVPAPVAVPVLAPVAVPVLAPVVAPVVVPTAPAVAVPIAPEQQPVLPAGGAASVLAPSVAPAPQVPHACLPTPSLHLCMELNNAKSRMKLLGPSGTDLHRLM